MDRANEQHVVVSDDVLCMATEELMSVLVTHWPTRNPEEDYADFVMSNGWLSNFKNRHGLRCRKTRGDGGGINKNDIPSMRADVQKELKDSTAYNSFNCDELALQYNLPENTISR